MEHQYSETNMMHFIFNLLSINGLYMFGALLAHPQEVLHKRHLVYCVIVIAVGCIMVKALIYQMPLVKRLLRMSK
jgi:hypothetical protein